jgi:endosialidase-like protein
MVSVQHSGLKALVNMIGFALAIILLTALVGAGPAAAQNTEFGTGRSPIIRRALTIVRLESTLFLATPWAAPIPPAESSPSSTTPQVAITSASAPMRAATSRPAATISTSVNVGKSEFSAIHIGTAGTQKKTFIAGISAIEVTGNGVEVNSNGQLGIAMSSARYKRDIRDMGRASAGLMKLRPVTFRYKNDPSDTVQYGLVAEEVEGLPSIGDLWP